MPVVNQKKTVVLFYKLQEKNGKGKFAVKKMILYFWTLQKTRGPLLLKPGKKPENS